MRLEQYISNLLKQHNCVIVPDFGGFVANYKSAIINEGKKKIFPPSKSVLFNHHLTNNDGLLANEVANQQNCSYPDALSLIKGKVNDWEKRLDEGDRVELEDLGFLFKREGQIHFEQSRDTNLLLSAYGLTAVEFVFYRQEENVTTKLSVVKQHIVEDKKTQPEIKEVKQPVEEKKIEKVTVEKETEVFNLEPAIEIVQKKKQSEKSNEVDSTVIPIQRNRFKTVMKYAAAVAIVPCLFYSYWIPMETDALDTGSIQLSDFNPIHSQVKKIYRPRTEETQFDTVEQLKSWEDLTANINADIYSYELTEDFYIPVHLERKETTFVDQSATQINADIDSPEVIHSSSVYQVIAGCFSVKENAQNLINDLNSAGFSAAIYDQKGGLHRVTAGGFNNRDAAKSALENVKSQGFSAWILKD